MPSNIQLSVSKNDIQSYINRITDFELNADNDKNGVFTTGLVTNKTSYSESRKETFTIYTNTGMSDQLPSLKIYAAKILLNPSGKKGYFEKGGLEITTPMSNCAITVTLSYKKASGAREIEQLFATAMMEASGNTFMIRIHKADAGDKIIASEVIANVTIVGY